MSSSLVISLDFELMWGVRDKRTVNSYGKNIMGGRKAIPEMLKLFEEFNIRATWATVGMLFAKDKEELLHYLPNSLPTYDDENLSPYKFIQNYLGENENEAPEYFAHSLVELIKNTTGQELATHTYSHYYCLEKGQTLSAFEEDIKASIKIANNNDVNITSIVFPRNQLSNKHINCCEKLGIKTYRGNPSSFLYKTRNEVGQTLFVRGGRLLDSILPLDGDHSYSLVKSKSKVQNIPASRLLRSAGRGVKSILTELQVKRIMQEMTSAAKKGNMYHLWWHPHNFGANLQENLQSLKTILIHFNFLKNEYGMESSNMNDLGESSQGFPLKNYYEADE